MKTKCTAAALTLLAAIILTAPAALAQPAPPGNRGQADARLLSNRLRELMKEVEKSRLPCATSNSVVGPLRHVDDALLSGRRSAASGMLAAFIPRIRSMQGAGLLTAELGSLLQRELGDILPQIGTGWPEKPMPTRRWPKLPACDAAAGVTVGSSGFVDWAGSDLGELTKLLLGSAVSSIPFAGMFLGPMLDFLWPQGDQTQILIDQAIATEVRNGLLADLAGLAGVLDLYQDNEWSTDAHDYWVDVRTAFVEARPGFQWGSIPGTTDYRVMLLPLFAQFENMYLGVLREGLLRAQDWGLDAAAIKSIRDALKDEVNPANTSVGIGYVNTIYNMGLAAQPDPTQSQRNWTARNKYVRDMTLRVLDYRDMWAFMDIDRWPKGVPNFKLTRMILSDPIGDATNFLQTFKAPAYADGPLQKLTVWDKSQFVIDAMQATGGPTAGPDITTPVMGDPLQQGTKYDFDVRPGSFLGPIVQVDGATASYGDPRFGIEKLSKLNLHLAIGIEKHLGGYGGDVSPTWQIFQYPGEVVAAVWAMGTWDVPNRGKATDTVVFGFRYADSFYPSGEVISRDSTMCITSGSSADGTKVLLGECQGGKSQTWTYYPPLQELRAFGGTKCLTAPWLAVPGDPLEIWYCSSTQTPGGFREHQRWAVKPTPRGGIITGVQSGLVLTWPYELHELQLHPDYGYLRQRWVTPKAVQGLVTLQGNGMCLNNYWAPNLKIAVCGGLDANETWVYSPSMRTLSNVGATKCIDAPRPAPGTLPAVGDPVIFNDCNGSETQEFLENPDGQISQSLTGLVLGVPSGSAAGTVVRLYTSNPNDPYRKWTWPMH